jgi:hypothetical protein
VCFISSIACDSSAGWPSQPNINRNAGTTSGVRTRRQINVPPNDVLAGELDGEVEFDTGFTPRQNNRWRSSMSRPYKSVVKRVVFLTALSATALASRMAALAAPDFPVPSSYPISWELKFEHGTPHRIAVDVTDSAVPKAYWYMTYTVTNEGDKEQKFYPQMELLTADGNVHKSDEKVPKKVFDSIKDAVHNKFLEPYTSISGPIRLGPAEARDGVAVWAETQPRMEHFSVFVTGLSGEAVIMKTVDGKLVKTDAAEDLYSRDNEDELLKKGLTIMRKTLQLNFYIRGDEVYPGEDEVNKTGEEWIMR